MLLWSSFKADKLYLSCGNSDGSPLSPDTPYHTIELEGVENWTYDQVNGMIFFVQVQLLNLFYNG